MEAEAEAVGILATPDALESRFQQLEGAGGAEEQLEALKRGLAGGRRPAAELPPGRPVREVLGPLPGALDYELEQLRRQVRGGQ
jgi:hypothetical protein